MTVREALSLGSSQFPQTPEDNPRLEAGVLLAFCLGLSREKLLACPGRELSPGEERAYRALAARRARGVPSAYLTGRREFYGREFYVDPRVLIPRPDTETLVEAALEIINRPGGRGAETSVVDICTGSGCIPLTLAWEVPGLKSAAADISPAAACVFALNRRLLRRPETAFYLSDLLNGVPGRWDLITANPPYLSPAEIEEKRRREGGPWGSAAAADWEEPELALNGGEGGLKILRRVIAQSPARLNPGGWLVMEGAPGQMNFLRKAMAEEGFLGVECVPDLAGRERVIRGYYGK